MDFFVLFFFFKEKFLMERKIWLIKEFLNATGDALGEVFAGRSNVEQLRAMTKL